MVKNVLLLTSNDSNVPFFCDFLGDFLHNLPWSQCFLELKMLEAINCEDSWPQHLMPWVASSDGVS